MPAVLMKTPSPWPASTTLVSPVTSRTPAAARPRRDRLAPRGRPRPVSMPSSRMKPPERSGRAPLMARSLTVPLTARSPMLPPGKNSGRTTKESVEKASRTPPSGEHRGVAELGASTSPPKAGSEEVLDQLGGHGPAAAVAHDDRRLVAQRSRAGPAGEVDGLESGGRGAQAQRGSPPGRGVLRAAGRGSRRRRRPRWRPSSRRAGCAACTRVPNASHSCGLIRPCSTSPLRQTRRLLGVDVGDVEAVLGVVVAVAARTAASRCRGIIADAAPGAVGDLEDVLEHRHRRRVALGRARRGGRRSRPRGRPRSSWQHGAPDALEDVQRLEAGDDDRHPVALGQRRVLARAHDAADVPGGQERLHPAGRATP